MREDAFTDIPESNRNLRAFRACLHTAGATGSIPVPPTISNKDFQRLSQAGSLAFGTVGRVDPRLRPFLLSLRLTTRARHPLTAGYYGMLCHMQVYGIICHMKARLAFHDKQMLPDGSIVEMKIWEVPESVPGSRHRLKYSLFYGRPGRRLIGYDNERGRGDHRHVEGKQQPYTFSTPEQLIEDFLADVRRLRGE
jgi:Family of unknown function (DUF6516)